MNQAKAIKTFLLTPTLLFLLALVTGCASTGSPDNDPMEGYNRAMTKFNLASDRMLLVPVARGYEKILPSPVRNGVKNFLGNLTEPYTILNDVLQGQFKKAGRNTGRFLINTTLGFVGFNDVASYMDLGPAKEDFGQTMAVWGVPSGPHLVLPFFGPSNIRDTGGLIPGFVYSAYGPAFEDSHANTGLFVLGVVNTRAQLLGVEELVELQPDPYLFLREGYRQRRALQISNGATVEDEESDDDLLDDLLEEE